MKSLLLTLLFLPLTVLSGEELPCDAHEEQAKSAIELARQVDAMEKKLREKNERYSRWDCENIIYFTSKEYGKISSMAVRSYRNYLENFLEEATKNEPEVLALRNLTEYLLKGEGLKLVLKNAAGKKSSQTLDNQLVTSYRTLRKTIADNKGADRNLPTTSHDCGKSSYVLDNEQKILDKLISTLPRLSARQNICVDNSYEGYTHPKSQKTITFDTSEGKALVWFCKQDFIITRDSKFGVENYSGDWVTSKASCLAWDLEANKPILGDQQQENIDGEADPFVEITDTRLELAKAKGKNPLTFEAYVEANPKLVADAPEPFYEAAVPNECKHLTLKYTYALNAAKYQYEKVPKLKKVEPPKPTTNQKKPKKPKK